MSDEKLQYRKMNVYMKGIVRFCCDEPWTDKNGASRVQTRVQIEVPVVDRDGNPAPSAHHDFTIPWAEKNSRPVWCKDWAVGKEVSFATALWIKGFKLEVNVQPLGK